MSQVPKLFDVMPADQFGKAMRAALPEDAALAWRHLGNLKVTGASIAVMDPAYYRPGHVLDDGRLLDWPDTEAQIWLQVIASSNNDVLRVAAVLLTRAFDRAANITKVEVGSSAVDSAKMMVADTARLRTCWNVGGKKNQSVLGVYGDKTKPKQQKERAARLLADAGFSLTRSRFGVYEFDQPLTDAQIASVGKLLKEAGIDEDVNVIQPHSLAVIEEGLTSSCVASLSDAESPYLFAFESGWGDGIYWWDAFRQDDNLVGYLCNFIEES
jgi:hypothetical protein